jgi:hypothetical protein
MEETKHESVYDAEGNTLHTEYKNSGGTIVRKELFYKDFAQDIHYSNDKITRIETWKYIRGQGWTLNGECVRYDDNGIVDHDIYENNRIIKTFYRNGQIVE